MVSHKPRERERERERDERKEHMAGVWCVCEREEIAHALQGNPQSKDTPLDQH